MGDWFNNNDESQSIHTNKRKPNGKQNVFRLCQVGLFNFGLSQNVTIRCFHNVTFCRLFYFGGTLYFTDFHFQCDTNFTDLAILFTIFYVMKIFTARLNFR